MKINGPNLPKNYYPYTSEALKSSSSVSSRTKDLKNQSFDKITISGASSARSTDDLFAAELKSRISQEVRKQTPQKELDDIKLQIKNGAYQLDLDEVSRKMLLQ